MFGFRGTASNGGDSMLPSLPTEDGDYALRVAGGVGSWVRTPIFQTVSVLGTDEGASLITLSNDVLDGTRLLVNAALRTPSNIMTGIFYSAGGGFTIIDDNGDKHAVAYLDDPTTPTEMQIGETAWNTAVYGDGILIKAGAGSLPFPAMLGGSVAIDAEGSGIQSYGTSASAYAGDSFHWGLNGIAVDAPLFDFHHTTGTSFAGVPDFQVYSAGGVGFHTFGGAIVAVSSANIALEATTDVGIAADGGDVDVTATGNVVTNAANVTNLLGTGVFTISGSKLVGPPSWTVINDVAVTGYVGDPNGTLDGGPGSLAVSNLALYRKTTALGTLTGWVAV